MRLAARIVTYTRSVIVNGATAHSAPQRQINYFVMTSVPSRTIPDLGAGLRFNPCPLNGGPKP